MTAWDWAWHMGPSGNLDPAPHCLLAALSSSSIVTIPYCVIIVVSFSVGMRSLLKMKSE